VGQLLYVMLLIDVGQTRCIPVKSLDKKWRSLLRPVRSHVSVVWLKPELREGHWADEIHADVRIGSIPSYHISL